MTIKELISELQKYPQDMIVTDGMYKIEKVSIIQEFYDGDSTNPKCLVFPAIKIE